MASQYIELSIGAFCNSTLRSLKVSTLGSDEDGENAGAISRSMMARSFGWRMMAYKSQKSVGLRFVWVLIHGMESSTSVPNQF
jgi:hypothetical protein